MFSSGRSPSTIVMSRTRLEKASNVARSVSVYALRSSAMPSVAPMPCPASMYQGAAGVTPACFHSASSSVWVPDLSPRETKRPPAARDPLERSPRPLPPLDLRRVLLRPDDDEVVVRHEPAIDHLAVSHVFLLQLGRVSERHVGLATSG